MGTPRDEDLAGRNVEAALTLVHREGIIDAITGGQREADGLATPWDWAYPVSLAARRTSWGDPA